MANIKSQIKRIRQDEKRRLRNKGVRSALKTYAKKFEAAVAAGDREAAERELRVATQHFDSAAEKGIIHKNTAANHKSKLMKKFNGFVASGAAEAAEAAAGKAAAAGATGAAGAKAKAPKAAATKKKPAAKKTAAKKSAAKTTAAKRKPAAKKKSD